MGGDGRLSSAGAQPSDTAAELLGTVLSGQANYYWVKLDMLGKHGLSKGLDVALPDAISPGVGTLIGSPAGTQQTLLCTRRSRLKKIGQSVWVGDRVRVEEPDWIDGRGAIAEVFERRTALDRPPVANVDQILLLFALAEPDLDPMQLSRFLVKAESTGLNICLGLNKQDLVSPDMLQTWGDRLATWGYVPVIFSLLRREGVNAIYPHLEGQITVVSGSSGVGKSSLINALIPSVDLRVGRVSGKLGRGRHTTRHVELFELPNGGLLADTPGFNQPDIDVDPAALGQCFPEIRERLAHESCQFSNCLHRDEPNCHVRGNWERYDHYLTFLEEAIAHQEYAKRRRDEEATQKVKTGESGEHRLEPKLETKRYRKPSRRAQRQNLQQLCTDLETLQDEYEDEQ